ncbi:phage tail protein I [Pseudoalteromonas luteoviolacea]|uniref:Tail protein n=1 Tax=Pseudoalteromonas luteoviolacea H33 TaxID=1365251 RepID=A0A161Y4N9_9GAMM|nr:phage tail protein I [Pseudoalteromonas luteoviolacea]KZN50239.1 tail protein [Pseudoalteromonas luteoviolacea H33]KZN76778.1 tail protein [Pseudoalteromonas luteoviolacea H33-S]
MDKLIPTNASELVKILSRQFPDNQAVRNLLLSLLALSTRSDAQLVWLAKLCGMQPNTVLANPDVLLQCNTKQLLVLVDHPEFCDAQQLDEFAKQLNIENWQSDEADALKRAQVKSACVLNDSRLLLASVWDPFLCPVALLPWLAWSVSVDEWDEAWSEALKRQVINDAFAVHQVKGTPYALQKALDSLNIKTEIKEWWQGDNLEALSRGTVQVWALINSNLDEQQQGMLTPQMLKRVRRIIEAVKRGSIHVDVQLGLSYNERLGAICAMPSTILQRMDAPIGSGVNPNEAMQKNAVFGAAQSRGVKHLAIAGQGIVPPRSTGGAGFFAVNASCSARHLAIAGQSVKPPKPSGAYHSFGATNSHTLCSWQVAGSGIKPGNSKGLYGVLGLSKTNQSHHLNISGQTVLPPHSTGNEGLFSVTRQIIYQHFNLQGAA